MDVRTLFERYHLSVFRYLLRMTGSRETTEDLTQEVFVRVSRSLSEYTDIGRERAWIFSIAVNVFRTSKRETARRRDSCDLRSVESRAVASPATRSIEKLSLAKALRSLDEIERHVFLLRELGGLSYAEIAAMTGLSEGSIRNRIYRARIALRAWLTNGLQFPRGRRKTEEGP